jgi:hypothetical protein
MQSSAAGRYDMVELVGNLDRNRISRARRTAKVGHPRDQITRNGDTAVHRTDFIRQLVGESA